MADFSSIQARATSCQDVRCEQQSAVEQGGSNGLDVSGSPTPHQDGGSVILNASNGEHVSAMSTTHQNVHTESAGLSGVRVSASPSSHQDIQADGSAGLSVSNGVHVANSNVPQHAPIQRNVHGNRRQGCIICGKEGSSMKNKSTLIPCRHEGCYACVMGLVGASPSVVRCSRCNVQFETFLHTGGRPYYVYPRGADGKRRKPTPPGVKSSRVRVRRQRRRRRHGGGDAGQRRG